jgi:hypothetical protein
MLAVLLCSGCGARIVPAAAPVPVPSRDEIETRLFLIGDAGAPDPRGEPVLRALGRLLDEDPARSLVVFLGDNIYPRGLPDSLSPGFPEADRRLDAQLEVLLARGVRGFLIPGNHDWDRFGPDGWNAVRRQGARVERLGRGLLRLVPAGGCPGPEVVDEGQWLRLVLVDTQWWLHQGKKPTDAGSLCQNYDDAAMGDALRSAVRSAGERRVVVVGHHPLASGGEHGGFFDWKDHLFPLRHVKPWLLIPLPLIGSAYPIARGMGVTSQDLSSGAYRRMRAAFAAAFDAGPPLVYAAGHDHGLQVLEGGPARYQLVSGAGIYGHQTPLTGIQNTRLALAESGFMCLDIARDGRVRLGVITVDRAGNPTEVYSTWLDAATTTGVTQ